MKITRRVFIKGTLGAGLTAFFGCSDEQGAQQGPEGNNGFTDEDAGMGDDVAMEDASTPDAEQDVATEDVPPEPGCADPFAGGAFMAVMPFIGEFEGSFHRRSSAGHDGRLLTDLREVEPGVTTIDNEEFFIRTLYPDQIDPDQPWQIRIHGMVEQEVTLTPEELVEKAAPMGNHVLECSGNTYHGSFGLLSAGDWEGVPLTALLDEVAQASPGATHILVSGFDEHSHVSTHSTPTASWVFSLEDVERFGGFLATGMNGSPLPEDHGKPVRLYMPNWYGCTCIKWVDSIEFVDENAQATPQMREFAQRTHQPGVPTLARDYNPATMHQAAMPVRIEKWEVEGELLYRLIGIMWGGFEVTEALEIRADNGLFEPVEVCPGQADNHSWTVWTHAWKPARTGDIELSMRINDPNIPQRRLDVGRYNRTVSIDEI